MLRWPGVALLTGGGISLVVGLVLNSVLPGLVRGTVMGAVSVTANVPASAIDLAGDLLESFAHQATAGFVPGTVAVMVLGAVMLAASLRTRRDMAGNGPLWRSPFQHVSLTQIIIAHVKANTRSPVSGRLQRLQEVQGHWERLC